MGDPVQPVQPKKDPNILKIKKDVIAQVKSELTKDVILKKFFRQDKEIKKSNTRLKYYFISAVVVFAAAVTIGFCMMSKTINNMYTTYIKDTEEIIIAKSDLELANSWERLPVQQRKERLRDQYFQIVRYYTNAVPEEQRMSNEQVTDSFNKIWACTQEIPSINFFMPVAYMKVATNFNPVYNVKYKLGITKTFRKTGEAAANLALVKSNSTFFVEFKGPRTLTNPVEAITLLIARMDDLMSTFHNREDWIFLALFTNEYTVIEKHWDGGKGKIPDGLYESGDLAEVLKYYHAFKNWQIPAVE